MTYDARYMPPFRINALVRLNPDWAALYPPHVRAQGSGTVGAHYNESRSSNVHFPDGTTYPIRDEHLLAATDGEPPAVQPPAPTAEQRRAELRRRVEETERRYQATQPNRRGRGGSSGSPLSPNACPRRLDPGYCEERGWRKTWGDDARFWLCANCGKRGSRPTNSH